jgi:hypothetical protein
MDQLEFIKFYTDTLGQTSAPFVIGLPFAVRLRSLILELGVFDQQLIDKIVATDKD